MYRKKPSTKTHTLFSKPRTRVSPTASAGQETDARIQRDGDLFHQGWEEGILHILEDTQGAWLLAG